MINDRGPDGNTPADSGCGRDKAPSFLKIADDFRIQVVQTLFAIVIAEADDDSGAFFSSLITPLAFSLI